MTNKLTDEINLHDNYAKSYIDYCKNDKITTFGTINTQPYDDYTKVILNNAYGSTNLFWSDGTKTVVKCGDNDIYDTEKGLAMAVAKKFLGTNKSHSNYMDKFKKWLPKEEEMSDSYDPFKYFRDSLKNLSEIGSSLKEEKK